MSLVVAIRLETAALDPAAPGLLRSGLEAFAAAAAEDGVSLVLLSDAAARPGELVGDAEDYYRTGRTPPDIEARWRRAASAEALAWRLGARLWAGPGFPAADLVVDAASLPPDWVAVAESLGVRFPHGDRSPGPPAVGAGEDPQPAPAPA